MLADGVDVVTVGAGVAGLVAAPRAIRHGASAVMPSEEGGASCWLQGANVALGHAHARDSTTVPFDCYLREVD